MKKISTSVLSLGMFLASSYQVFAEPSSISISPPDRVQANMGVIISRTIGVVLILSALVTFVFLVWGGFEWLISGGDKGKVEAAQHRIQAALLGLFIVFAAWAIMSIVGQFFGFDIGNLQFKGLIDG